MPILQKIDRVTVVNLHRTPRWGHSNTFSHLFSPNPPFQVDYAQGIVAFGFFLTTLLLLWLLILFLLKLLARGQTHLDKNGETCGMLKERKSPIGCAAGGNVIDVQYIKRHRRDLKPHLQAMVNRSWRVQSVFFLASILLPVAIYLFLTRGLTTLVSAVHDLKAINNDIQQLTDRSFGIMESLLKERDRIRQMDQAGMLSVDRHCPNLKLDHNGNGTAGSIWNTTTSQMPIAFLGIDSDLSATLDAMDRLVDENVIYARQGLTTVRHGTTSIQKALEFINDNDWVPKMFVMILAIVNLFFLAGVLLSRCNIIIFPLKCMQVWFLMPVFILLLIVAVIGTSTFGMMASANADFCAGGGVNANITTMSPKGTIEEIVLSHIATKSDIMYQAFDYFMNVRQFTFSRDVCSLHHSH